MTLGASPDTILDDDSRSRARMRDGTSIAYSLHRHGSERRVVLIHSLAMNRDFWRPVATALADKASILAYDCRGHGISDKPEGPYSVELFADDLADLLDEIGWSSALIAGASMGGCIASAFAARYPERTKALSLIDTTTWYGPDAPAQWAERAQRAIKNGLASLAEFQTTRWFGDQFRAEHPEVVTRCMETFLRNDVTAYVEVCKMLGACDTRAALAKFAMPCAVIVGEQDYATPIAMAEYLHRSISGSTLTILKNARHLTPLEQPEQIAAELLNLLAIGNPQ